MRLRLGASGAGKLCARGVCLAWSCGPSTSPLGARGSAVRRLSTTVGLLAVLNVAVYIALAFALGGDAVNGHVESGHYYLAMHGRLTEVSRRVFEFSRWYTYVLWLHFGTFFVLRLWLWVRSTPPRTPNNRWSGP
jgi:hypothetical protein